MADWDALAGSLAQALEWREATGLQHQLHNLTIRKLIITDIFFLTSRILRVLWTLRIA
jgi:hypothetical protein